jgi:hypothetical protein
MTLRMSRTVVCPALLGIFLLAPLLHAQSSGAASSTSTCNLDDGRQVYIRYSPVPSNKEKIVNGKAWSPGGTAMTLFTEAQLNLGSSLIPIGAYTVYPIPGRDHWTLAVNKNVSAGSAYDEKSDLARAAMETAQVPQPADALEVAFAHVGAKCTLRIYYGKSASFADFIEK